MFARRLVLSDEILATGAGCSLRSPYLPRGVTPEREPRATSRQALPRQRPPRSRLLPARLGVAPVPRGRGARLASRQGLCVAKPARRRQDEQRPPRRCGYLPGRIRMLRYSSPNLRSGYRSSRSITPRWIASSATGRSAPGQELLEAAPGERFQVRGDEPLLYEDKFGHVLRVLGVAHLSPVRLPCATHRRAGRTSESAPYATPHPGLRARSHRWPRRRTRPGVPTPSGVSCRRRSLSRPGRSIRVRWRRVRPRV